MWLFRTHCYIFLLISLSSCAWLSEDVEDDQGMMTERDFYEKIQESLSANNWSLAISNLQLLESQFPFGNYAEQGQLELIYAHYKTNDYESSIAAADRFIRLHPQHKNVDYAFYVKGLSQIAQSEGFLDNYMPTDASMRDIGDARLAFTTLSELIENYPDSPYAFDARQRLISIRNRMARAEIHVANYYFTRGAYMAAANRGKYVVENFQQTPAVPDGLAVMIQAYKLLSLDDLIENPLQILNKNYPEHPSLNDDGTFNFDYAVANSNGGILDRLSLGLIQRENPPKFDSREIFDKPTIEGKKQKRNEKNETSSFLNRITFGIVK
jgi:outer membrane protein assembly factor BamD